MKKILLIMFCMILLVAPMVSAELFTWDNIKQYDEVTQTITIKNSLLHLIPLKTITTARLDTPQIYQVRIGEKVKIARFTINPYMDYENLLEEFEINDLKDNGKEITREIVVKYWGIEDYLVNDYDCSKGKCNIIGSHIGQREAFVNWDKNAYANEEVIVELYMDMFAEETFDWKPTIAGVKIKEWAIVTSGNVTTIDGDYTVVTYLNNGTFNNTGVGFDATILVLGGGGGVDGTNYAGGGGGGGIDYDASYTINVQNYDVIVGAGGNETNGGNSTFGTLVGIGGGAGGSESIDGKDGGSGGGSGGVETTSGGTGIQGGDGGDAPDGAGGSGGGGMSENGDAGFGGAGTERGGDGGNGTVYDINGTSVCYAGGGGGSGKVVVAIGGCGGGDGGIYESTGATAGTDGLGGGGGGNFVTGGEDGGSGVVIIRYLTSDAEKSPPIVTLNTPIDNANFSISNINHRGVVVSNTINLIANVSFILDDVYIETNTSGINNSNYTFTSTPIEGEHTWTYESCNNESQCTNGTTRTFTIDYLVEEGIFFTSQSHETQQETFTINVTTNGTSTTSAEFFYNDISQGASTKTGTNINANFSNTFDIPLGNGTKEFYWKVTAGGVIDSTKTNQTVNETVWAYCNATYTVPFLNVSFKDEADLSFINATIPTSNFVYYLGSGDVIKTYTYINSTENYYYEFCATPNMTMSVNPYIQYKKGTTYPQRIYDPDITSYTNDTTDLTLYLLGTIDGIYVTFQVINTANLVLSGVDMNASREIAGEDVEVGTGITGADGGVTLWLNPDFVHDFVFNKSGFPILEESFAPTQTAYTITLGGGVETTNSYFKGITYSVLPTNISLTNDTTYTFGFNLTSSFWDLTSYSFDLRLVNGTIITGGSTAISGTPLTKVYNTNNQTKIYLDYNWLINGTYTNGTSIWVVYSTLNTQWSIGTFFRDFNIYMDSGFFGIDDFGRYLIIFIVIFFTVGIMSFKFGFTSPINISVMTFLIVFFFDVVVGIIPPLSIFSGNEVNYLLTMLTGLIATITVLREATRV